MAVAVSTDDIDHATTWCIQKTTYRRHQADGRVLIQISFRCPAAACSVECDEIKGLGHHIADVHGVILAPEYDKNLVTAKGGEALCFRKLTVASGEQVYVCPRCIQQFPLNDKVLLYQHLATEHGIACAPLGMPDKFTRSDDMDSLWQAPSSAWYPNRDRLLERIRVISLGSYCSPKLSMQRMGIGEASLPFDWVRSTCDGVEHFIRNSFSDFFSIATFCEVPESNMKMYRSRYHSFWHDNIEEQSAREKLQRRIDRLMALKDDKRDLLFIRSVATTDELPMTEILYETLLERFGGNHRVLLAVIVDGQNVFNGPIGHSGYPGIIFIAQPLLPTEGGRAHIQAITCAADVALAAPVDCDPDAGFGLGIHLCTSYVPFLSGAALLPALDFFDQPLQSGFGNLRCFETQATEHFDLAVHSLSEVPVIQGEDV